MTVLATILITYFIIGNIVWRLKRGEPANWADGLAQYFFMVFGWPFFLIY